MKAKVMNSKPKIGFIGFGEVTQYISKGLLSDGIEDILVFSRAFSDSKRKKSEQYKGKKFGVELTSSLQNVVKNSDIVFSSVRGDVALQFAKNVAPFIRKDQIFIDLNNAIPEVKQKSAALIEEQGGLFVDVGLLELPVQVEHRALMYASGKGSEKLKRIMAPYGMNIKCLGKKTGKAALIKVLANVYMKGIQGVCLEFALSAYKAGIDMDHLQPLLIKPLESMERHYDVPFWITRGTLLASRKATEMKEAIKMLKELDINPVMLTAATDRLSKASKFELNNYFEPGVSPGNYKAIIKKHL